LGWGAWLGFAVCELGWRPCDFWHSSPAELAAIATYLRDKASGLDASTVAQLRAQLGEQHGT